MNLQHTYIYACVCGIPEYTLNKRQIPNNETDTFPALIFSL